jgi:hypothetical protein
MCKILFEFPCFPRRNNLDFVKKGLFLEQKVAKLGKQKQL